MSKWKNFKKEKKDNLLGYTEVRFEQIPPKGEVPVMTPFTVVANPKGIYIHGTMIGMIEDMQQLDEFAQVVSDAWKDHLALKPKIVKPGSNEF